MELIDFVEAPGRFIESTTGVLIECTPRFVVVADTGGVWAAVQGIRLASGDAPQAVEEVREILAQAGSRIVSWWLTDRSTPEDAEAQLLEAGLRLVANDYRLDGLLATSPPPLGPPDVVVRRVDSVDDWIAVRELQEDVFENPPERRHSRQELASDYERTNAILFGGWLDGEVVAAGAATPTSRGLHLWGGATRPHARGRGCYRALVRARWDEAVRRGTPALAVNANDKSSPVLRDLGFEKALEFRRLEDVLSTT